MPRSLHIRLTGESEEFLTKLKRLGLSEQDAIGQALSLLKTAYDTERVALLKLDASPSIADQIVDYILVVGGIKNAKRVDVTASNQAKAYQGR